MRMSLFKMGNTFIPFKQPLHKTPLLKFKYDPAEYLWNPDQYYPFQL